MAPATAALRRAVPGLEMRLRANDTGNLTVGNGGVAGSVRILRGPALVDRDPGEDPAVLCDGIQS
ncbi:hypothetical protein JCM13580A_46510 [Streptomyces drozdowiczii]